MIEKMRKILTRMDIQGLFVYLIVGGGATVVEWVIFWLLTTGIAINYLVATTIAMFVSTFANWGLGRMLLFRDQPTDRLAAEIGKVYLASVVGWLASMLLMWIMVDQLHMQQMVAKIIATGVVFLYNYIIRKLLIYKDAT